MTIDELYNIYRRHKHTGIESEKMNNGITVVPMSFETGEQTATRIYFPFAVKILKLRGIVTKALAATDSGTIQGANSTGDSTGGLLTAAASAALNTEYATTGITTNFYVGKDSYYQLTSTKTTAGGKILVTIEWERV